MANQNSKNDNQERRFSQEQYEMLKRCSDKKDMTEWNKWREKNKTEHIYLEGANFNNFCLEGVRLDEDPINIFGKVYLEDAEFRLANLKKARFVRAHLEKTDFYHANLEKSLMNFAHVEGAKFSHSDLKGAQLPFCTVDGNTMLLYCEINLHTWFYGVGLDSLRIGPETKQLLEYNIRRNKWEEWYKEHPNLKWIVKPFWWVSDYGLSTGRIAAVFLGVVFVFANIYYHWGRIAPPGIIEDLFEVSKSSGEIVVVPSWLVPLRTLYFSVAAMIGFSEVSPCPDSICGYILILVQAILGYVLLGALVTRFAVLFTAGGPAGRFADDE